MITTVNGPWWQLRLLARNLLNEYVEREPLFHQCNARKYIKVILIQNVGLRLYAYAIGTGCPLSQNRHRILYTLIHALSMHQRYKYGQAFHPPPCQLRHFN